MKTYFDLYPFTHYIPLDGHNVTLTGRSTYKLTNLIT
jgi:hypothetical protein